MSRKKPRKQGSSQDQKGREKRQLSELYKNPVRPSAFGGKKRLYASAKNIKRKDVDHWLAGEDTYTLHKPVRTRFQRRPTITSGVFVQAQADLMDVRSHIKHNDGVAFLLTIIDVFSRKAWVFPLKNKSGSAVSTALRNFDELENFRYLQTDKGKEFYNSDVRGVLKSSSIHHFSTENETIKASIIERFNRTLKDKIHRYLTATGRPRYIHVIDDLVQAYNTSIHSSIGMKPNEVTFSNQEDVWYLKNEELASNLNATRQLKFTIGDHVRISKARGAFERGYTPNWTTEIFLINKVFTHSTPVVYGLKDLGGEEVSGTFYKEELQKVILPETFLIEKVVEKRKKKGSWEYLVKWVGYPDSFNSWVNKKDMIDV